LAAVALERQSIEKKDFPIGRRGYDPQAVDAHLRAVADELEELKRGARQGTETLASTASEKVRAIVEAAETSAADIRRQAEEEARELTADARNGAQSTREEATAKAREYVDKVSEAAKRMQQRLEAMDSELGTLVESLRAGSARLVSDLNTLESNLAEVRDSVTPRFEPLTEAEPEPGPAGSLAEPPEPERAAREEALAETHAEQPAAPPSPISASAAPAAVSAAANGDEDIEGARLVALNMALNGTPREETDRYLAAHFYLLDRAALLDANVGG
jgi:DivIVA domain-containing protein